MNLPPEVWLNVCSHLSSESLSNLSKCNSFFNELTRDDRLWKRLCMIDFPKMTVSEQVRRMKQGTSYKQVFSRLHQLDYWRKHPLRFGEDVPEHFNDESSYNPLKEVKHGRSRSPAQWVNRTVGFWHTLYTAPERIYFWLSCQSRVEDPHNMRRAWILRDSLLLDASAPLILLIVLPLILACLFIPIDSLHVALSEISDQRQQWPWLFSTSLWLSIEMPVVSLWSFVICFPTSQRLPNTRIPLLPPLVNFLDSFLLSFSVFLGIFLQLVAMGCIRDAFVTLGQTVGTLWGAMYLVYMKTRNDMWRERLTREKLVWSVFPIIAVCSVLYTAGLLQSLVTVFLTALIPVLAEQTVTQMLRQKPHRRSRSSMLVPLRLLTPLPLLYSIQMFYYMSWKG